MAIAIVKIKIAGGYWMNKKYLKLGLVIAFFALAFIIWGMLQNNTQGQLTVKSIPAPSLSNNLLGDPTNQNIAIYLPESYATSNKHYPVVYFLPGFCDGFASYGTDLQKAMDFMLSRNKVKEMIVVSINGVNKLHGSYYVNSPVIGNWEDFVVKDVVNYIDENYRTIPTAESRGIAGHSMGGFGSLNIAMHHPDIFSYVYSMSPGLFDPNGLSKVDFDYTKESPYASLTKEKAHEDYLEMIKTVQWPEDFAYAYGSAFSPDAQGKAPYVKFVNKNLSPAEQKNDPIWQAWYNGYGNWEQKVPQYKSNLLQLKGIVIDYGKQDDYAWIPDGCNYFSELLKKENIPHELYPYEGNHMNQVRTRLEENMLPYFSSHLVFE